MSSVRLRPREVRARAWRRRSRLGATITWLARGAAIFITVCAIGAVVLWQRLSDPESIRRTVQTMIEGSVGGDVRIGPATASLFGGFELRDIVVTPPGESTPLVRIASLKLAGDIVTLVRRDWSAAEIVAAGVEVNLVESADDSRWNFQRLEPRRSGTGGTPGAISIPPLRIEDVRVRHLEQSDGVETTLGEFDAAGRLESDAGGELLKFAVGTRTDRGVGPSISGSVAPRTGRIEATLVGLELDRLRSMLPRRVREFWDSLNPAGRIDATEIRLARDAFAVELKLEDVGLDLALPGRRDVADAPRLQAVRGGFVIASDGVIIQNLTGRVGNVPLELRGRINGFSPEAPMSITVGTAEGKVATLGAGDDWPARLPPPLDAAFLQFRPSGTFTSRWTFNRSLEGQPLVIDGSCDFTDATFVYHHFAYPVVDASGRIAVRFDHETKRHRMVMENIRGLGGEPANATANVKLEGVIEPLTEYAGISIEVSGTDVELDPKLVSLLPHAAQEAIAAFDDGNANPPWARGDFVTRVVRVAGPDGHWSFDTDVKLVDARGRLKAFPWPVESAAGLLEFRGRRVNIIGLDLKHGDGVARVDGTWDNADNGGTFAISAKSVPIDDGLLDALPRGAGTQLREFKLAGTLDAAGTVGVEKSGRLAGTDVAIKTVDASFEPLPGFVVNSLAAVGRLRADSIVFEKVAGAFDRSPVDGSVRIDWADEATLEAAMNVRNLSVNAERIAKLPEVIREAIQPLRPEGTLELTATARGSAAAPTIEVVARPTALRITPADWNQTLLATAGQVSRRGESATLSGVVLAVGEGSITVDGTIENESADLIWSGRNIDLSSPAIKKLLAGVSSTVTGTIAAGEGSVERTKSSAGVETKFTAMLELSDAGMADVVDVAGVAGRFAVSGRVADGVAQRIDATLDARSMWIESVGVSPAKMTMSLEPVGGLVIDPIDLRIAGGAVAGRLESMSNAKQGKRTAVRLTARGVNLAELSATPAEVDNGIADASLDLEWNAPPRGKPTLRGRGEVNVVGRGMVRVPFLVGATQMLSLALPFTGSFDEASASYVIDGPRVEFTAVRLSSDQMKIRGTGRVDYESREIDFDFYTDKDGPRLPVIADILEAARRELFQIRVRGTLGEPQVKAGTLPTVAATVKEVLREKPKDAQRQP